MPLYLTANQHVDVPVGATYQSAFRGMPAFSRDLLEEPRPLPGDSS
jgi:hypothetical protein